MPYDIVHHIGQQCENTGSITVRGTTGDAPEDNDIMLTVNRYTAKGKSKITVLHITKATARALSRSFAELTGEGQGPATGGYMATPAVKFSDDVAGDIADALKRAERMTDDEWKALAEPWSHVEGNRLHMANRAGAMRSDELISLFDFNPDDREGAPVPFPDWSPIVAVLTRDFAHRHGWPIVPMALWPRRTQSIDP